MKVGCLYIVMAYIVMAHIIMGYILSCGLNGDGLPGRVEVGRLYSNICSDMLVDEGIDIVRTRVSTHTPGACLIEFLKHMSKLMS